MLLHVATSDVGAALRVRVFAPGIYDREEDNVKRPEDVERFLGREIACAETPAGDEVVIRIPESERKYWTQDTPWLYWVLVSAEQEGGIRDEAAAYFFEFLKKSVLRTIKEIGITVTEYELDR